MLRLLEVYETPATLSLRPRLPKFPKTVQLQATSPAPAGSPVAPKVARCNSIWVGNCLTGTLFILFKREKLFYWQLEACKAGTWLTSLSKSRHCSNAHARSVMSRAIARIVRELVALLGSLALGLPPSACCARTAMAAYSVLSPRPLSHA